MRPVLFSVRVGGNEAGLHTYGLLVAAGFAVGVLLFWREGRRQGLDGGRLLDLSFWSIVAGLVGSRLAFVGLNAREFTDACFGPGVPPEGNIAGCMAALRFWDGGFVFYGGVLATGMVLLLFCRREGWSFWRVGDLAAPTLAIGHAFGRVGCFFAGCCFGKACSSPWGVTFPPGSVAHEELLSLGVLAPHAARTSPLHATQLYEAAGELALFVLLLMLRRRWRRAQVASEGEASEARGRLPASRRLVPGALPGTLPGALPAALPGALLLTYAVGYGLLRFLVEVFRGDTSRRYVAEWSWPRLAVAIGLGPQEPLLLSVAQLISLIILAGVVLVVWWRRKHPEAFRR